MNRIIQLIKWFLRSWPVLIPIALGLIHYEVNIHFGHNIGIINKIVASVVQFLGGVLVLYSINENMGIFKRENLLQMIRKWFIDIPLKKKNYVLHAETLTGKIVLGEGILTVRKIANTLEERLTEIERRVDETRLLIKDSEKRLHEKIDVVSSSLEHRITQNSSELKKLDELLRSSVVGSIKLQVFGVFLVLYGAIINLL